MILKDEVGGLEMVTTDNRRGVGDDDFSLYQEVAPFCTGSEYHEGLVSASSTTSVLVLEPIYCSGHICACSSQCHVQH